MKLSNKFFIMSGSLFGVFLLLTILVLCVDVKAVPPLGENVGLSDFNTKLFNVFGTHHAAKVVSDILGYASILLALCFVAIFVCQWIKRKSLKKIDIELYTLLIFYAIIGVIYVLFLFVVINYRPAELESSYPSSHTLLFCFVLLSAMFYLHYFTKNQILTKVLQAVLGLLTLAGVLCRLFSGVHWTTDILAALFLSGALLSLLWGTNLHFEEKNEKLNKQEQQTETEKEEKATK